MHRSPRIGISVPFHADLFRKEGNRFPCNHINLLSDSTDRVNSLFGNRRVIKTHQPVLRRERAVFANDAVEQAVRGGIV